MKLIDFIEALEAIYPLTLAAEWDPAGLQVEPAVDAEIHRILVTLDLTSPVVEEAEKNQADLIIAYHPPLFAMPDRLTQAESKARILIRCVQSGIAVYSPHTVLDAVPGGVTDWLASALGDGCSEVMEPNPHHPDAGHGRLYTLSRETTADDLAERLQSTLQLPWVRTAVGFPSPRPIRTVAVCPGAGHSVIEKTNADALLTGEMRHHDLLAAQEKGQTVFLCEHAASERGYLEVYAQAIRNIVGDGIPVEVSDRDQGPLTELQTSDG